MSNIKNNNYRKIDCRIINDNYMDFMLSKSDANNNNLKLNESYFGAILNFDKQHKKHVVSDVAWVDSVVSDTILENIGYTGVDNGFISYDKDMTGNDEFLNLFTKSTFDLSTFKDKFFVTEITGNTHTYNYPIELENDYTALKGGFYQGFFKIDGDNYQTLPHKIDNEWNFIFNLRRRDYKTDDNILNKSHPNNSGMFFYIGTRAENKFWELYDHGINNEDNVNDKQYYEDDYFILNDALEDNYVKDQISLDNISLKDSDGYNIEENNIYEIETDNKFIIFNQSKDGFNIKTWDNDYKFMLTGKTIDNNINYFQYLNNTKNGYNKNNIHEVHEELKKEYDVHKDIKNNAFGLKINDDGSITYRYMANCELIEETSKPNLVKVNEWNNIHLKMSRIENKMILYVYINGYLKFVSKELPEINLKPLNEHSNKQEGVPYNISIGGGSQGLCERIFLDYYNNSEYKLPIEQYFAGSFIGDIKKFVFIPYQIDFNYIYNNRYLYK